MPGAAFFRRLLAHLETHAMAMSGRRAVQSRQNWLPSMSRITMHESVPSYTSALRFERGQLLLADEPRADLHVEVQPILDDLVLRHTLDIQARSRARDVFGRRRPVLVVVLCPASQYLRPKASDAHRLSAIEVIWTCLTDDRAVTLMMPL